MVRRHELSGLIFFVCLTLSWCVTYWWRCWAGAGWWIPESGDRFSFWWSYVLLSLPLLSLRFFCLISYKICRAEAVSYGLCEESMARGVQCQLKLLWRVSQQFITLPDIALGFSAGKICNLRYALLWEYVPLTSKERCKSQRGEVVSVFALRTSMFWYHSVLSFFFAPIKTVKD